MKKIFTYKFLISIFVFNLLLIQPTFAKPVFVSLSPTLTEMMYALNAQNLLKGVSSECQILPSDKKEIVGNNYFINIEKVLKIKPDYILAFDSSEYSLGYFKYFKIQPLCLKYPNIESIYQNILYLGKLTGQNEQAKIVVENSRSKIDKIKKNRGKKILYLVQTEPMISIGSKSFITDAITKSGNISVTKSLNFYYPVISEEYSITQKPDIIILGMHSNQERIRKMFPNSKIVVLTKEQNDIVNRPGIRIQDSVNFFANL